MSLGGGGGVWGVGGRQGKVDGSRGMRGGGAFKSSSPLSYSRLEIPRSVDTGY